MGIVTFRLHVHVVDKYQLRRVANAAEAPVMLADVDVDVADATGNDLTNKRPPTSIPNQKDETVKPSTLPGILLNGAQKAGTSALSAWLFGIGGMCRSYKTEFSISGKEVHFFDKADHFNQGVETYKKKFEHCAKNMALAMDSTPNYLPEANKIFSTYQEAGEVSTLKIIFSLREPISRELSWYNHLVANHAKHAKKRDTRNYQFMVDEDGKSMITFDKYTQSRLIRTLGKVKSNHGFYAEHLATWFELFDREQILILFYDEVNADPQKVKWRIKQFLGLDIADEQKGFPIQNAQQTATKVALPSCASQRTLTAIFEPYNEKLYRLLEANPGPSMEQKPFPGFHLGNCTTSSG
jgi:hypothetical protein